MYAPVIQVRQCSARAVQRIVAQADVCHTQLAILLAIDLRLRTRRQSLPHICVLFHLELLIRSCLSCCALGRWPSILQPKHFLQELPDDPRYGVLSDYDSIVRHGSRVRPVGSSQRAPSSQWPRAAPPPTPDPSLSQA